MFGLRSWAAMSKYDLPTDVVTFDITTRSDIDSAMLLAYAALRGEDLLMTCTIPVRDARSEQGVYRHWDAGAYQTAVACGGHRTVQELNLRGVGTFVRRSHMEGNELEALRSPENRRTVLWSSPQNENPRTATRGRLRLNIHNRLFTVDTLTACLKKTHCGCFSGRG